MVSLSVRLLILGGHNDDQVPQRRKFRHVMFTGEEGEGSAGEGQAGAIGNRESRSDLHDPHAVLVLRDDGEKAHPAGNTADNFCL